MESFQKATDGNENNVCLTWLQ